MINLDNITLNDPADIEKVNSNFQKIQPAVNDNEQNIKENADLIEAINNKTDEEITRATDRENTIETNLNTEITRATNRENTIANNVQTNTSSISILQNSVATHTQQISNLQDNLAEWVDSFNTKADLDAYSGPLSNNDWAIVLDDETHSHQCWRYVYKGSTSSWEPQFMINESPLTQMQLNALNSGIDSTKVAQIATNTSDIANKISKTVDIQAMEKVTELPSSPVATTLYFIVEGT